MLTLLQYWFDPLRAVLKRLSELCPRPEAIQLKDWRALRALPSRAAVDVEQLFYANAPAAVLASAARPEPHHRSKGFLAGLNDAEYYRAYQLVLAHPERPFPDIEAILNRGRREGMLVTQVVANAVRWVNPEPAAVPTRENNKPPHWQGFVPPLGDVPRKEAESIARQLQRDMFGVLRDRLDEIDGGFEGDMANPAYLERFGAPIWHELLTLVHQAVGPRFCGQLASFNTALPASPRGLPTATLSRELGAALFQMPEVRGNPVLRSGDAIQELVRQLLPAVAGWALEQCTEAVTAEDLGTTVWSPSVMQHVRTRQLVFREMVQALPSPDPLRAGRGQPAGERPPPPLQRSPRPGSPRFRPVNAPLDASEPPGSDAILQSFGLNDMNSRRRLHRQAPTRHPPQATIPGTQWASPVSTVDRVHQSRITLPAKPLGEPAWMSRRPARANRS
jgi:hypothetical protein